MKSFGAHGDGRTDDSAAIQAAINAIDAGSVGGGGTVYFPPGRYRTTVPLTKAGPAEVRLLGERQTYMSGSAPDVVTEGSSIAWDSPSRVINVIQATGGALVVEQLSISPLQGPSNSAAGYTGIYSTVPTRVRAVNIFGTLGTGNVTTGVEAAGASWSIVEDCNIAAWTQAVWMNGGQLMTIRDCVLTTVPATGSGSIRMDNGAQTLRIRSSQTQSGDRGLHMLSGSGDAPAFVFIDDFEVNIPMLVGVELANGSQVYADKLWLSYAGGPSTTLVHGLVVESTFTGFVQIENAVVQDFTGHGVWLQGGRGFVLANASLGGSGTHGANAYDDFHVAAGVSDWGVQGCHFSTDPYMEVNGARSAVYVEPGSSDMFRVEGNSIASGYGIAAVMDQSTGTTKRIAGNLGWNPRGAGVTQPAVPASGEALTNPTGTDCTVTVSDGVVSSVAIGGVGTGLISGSFRVPAGQSITLTYSEPPRWIWFGD